MDLVTAIIPTYNRFDSLMLAIRSVKEQTYKNIEIIVVNDRSTDKRYYQYSYPGCTFIHCNVNARDKLGFANPGDYQRNIAQKIANGDYLAFLDDDDYWLPEKIEKQLHWIKETKCKMCCTEGLYGRDPYKKEDHLHWHKYNNWHYQGQFWPNIQSRFKDFHKSELLEEMFRGDVNVWSKECIEFYNVCIASSVMIDKRITRKAGDYPVQSNAGDWAYWKEISEHTDIAYIREPLVYVNGGSTKEYTKGY